MVRSYGVDGVTLEIFPKTHIDEHGISTLGYDAPA